MIYKNKQKELENAGAKLPKDVVPRKLLKEIIPWLNRKEIILISGARQTGKSVLLYQLIYNHLLTKTQNIYYFNLDTPNQLDFISKQDNLINLVKKTKGKVYIIIDEVQRLKEPGLYLKGIYDLQSPLKLIVSGSSSLEIKSKVHEALTGRKIVFHLNPFDIEELSGAIFPDRRFNELMKSKEDFNAVLNHYLIYGGYPAVSLAKDKKIKLQLLREIFHSYLEKDVKDLLKIENETAFINLVKILSSQIGNLVNKDELSNTIGIHKNTLDNYLFYLEETFVLDFVRPFYKNPRKELLKSPKVYFNDLGFRNFAINGFNDLEFRADKGSLFENLCYLVLKNKFEQPVPVNFWRTKAGAEVDFILQENMKPIPFEAKASVLKEVKVSKSLRSFLESYTPEKAYCINMKLNEKVTIEKTELIFLSLQSLLKLKL